MKRQSDGEQLVPDITDDTFLYETRMNSGSRWNICSPTGLQSHCAEELYKKQNSSISQRSLI